MSISMEVWGDLACFSPPWAKIERLTYPFPTPSAARGILSAVYVRPIEFRWEIERIEVLRPIRYVSFKRNEVKSTISERNPTCIYTDDDRTQRQTVALQDVRYRIVARIVPRRGFEQRQRALEEQALRRIRSGKCFFQPSLGLREFAAYFAESDGAAQPIPVDLDAGLMLYDVFDLHECEVTKKAQPQPSLFHAVMRQGVIEVPPYDSPEVLKGGPVC